MLSVLPYLPSALLQRAGEIPATTQVVQEMVSARPIASYVPSISPPGRSPYFLSVSAAALGLLGLFAPLRRFAYPGASPYIGQVRVAAVAIGVAGFVLSLGPTLRLPGDLAVPLPFRLVALMPGFAAFRAPVRFGTLVARAASILAGLGVAAVCGAARRRWLRVTFVAAALGTFAVEIGHLPVPLRALDAGESVAPVYRWLATHGNRQPVLELPVGIDSAEFGAMYDQSRYTYFSTYHWSPLLNGHGAYPPDSFFFLMAIARRLPDPPAVQDLVTLTGLRWIVLHDAASDGAARDRWVGSAAAGLVRVERFGNDILFQVTVEAEQDLRAKLALPAKRPTTLSGVPVRLLPPEGMRGELRDLAVPSVSRHGLTFQGRVTVTNGSDLAWPGFRPDPAGLIHLGYRWFDADGHPLSTAPRLTRIPTDVGPGESVRVPFAVQPPERAGRYRLRVTLVQKDGAWFDEHGGPFVDASVEIAPRDGSPRP
jgi:hypothetical protein